MVNFLRVMPGKMASGARNCPTGGESAPRRYSGPVLLALFLVSALPAFSDPLTFTGDTLITLSSGAHQTGVDLSGLQFGNTANGVEISGILAVSFPDTGGVLTVGVLEIVSQRFFVAPLGTDVTPLAHANGMYVNNEGGLWISSIGVTTLLHPHPSGSGPCGSSVGADVGDFSGPFAGSGTFDFTSTENNVNPQTPCSTVGDDSGPFQNSLTQVFSVSYVFTGSAGSFTIDLGNSIVSELTPVSPEPPVSVPEPSALLLLSSTLLMILFKACTGRKSADSP